ncbi:MAG: fibrillarin-like rRNA/tRNA 2'-O-methyltransferase [Candidatus Aenigmarchaeota archaeon]|nr:fibrillarin-like rRNA/tRNA 2'-O-methyltransferase [Candidatus Aenigmarchaeota archaeon]
MKEISPGIFFDNGKIFTLNMRPGQKVYGEPLLKSGKTEYREWIPYRSKLAAAIKKGLKKIPIKKGMKILYLGSATGTTPSHLSDIVGEEGIIFAVEFSERMMREFLKLCNKRRNLIPILADARKPQDYADVIEKVDLVYCDVAQPDATEIAIRNCREFLKPQGHLMIAIKSRSVDITKNPNQIYREEIKKIKKAGFSILKWLKLGPLEKDHAFIMARQIPSK